VAPGNDSVCRTLPERHARCMNLSTNLSRLWYIHSGHDSLYCWQGLGTAAVRSSFGQGLYCCVGPDWPLPTLLESMPSSSNLRDTTPIPECTRQTTVCHRLAAAGLRLACKLQSYVQYQQYVAQKGIYSAIHTPTMRLPSTYKAGTSNELRWSDCLSVDGLFAADKACC